MKAPKQTQFRLDTLGPIPEELRPVFQKLLEQLNGFTEPVGAVLAQGLTRSDNMDSSLRPLRFTVNTWPIEAKNDLGRTPTAVWVAKLRKSDGATISDPWSFSWALDARGNLLVTFQGLESGVGYEAVLLQE